MTTTKIYALFDPREPLQVRYVGKTTRKLRERLKGHLSEAKFGDDSYPKNRWIRELLGQDMRPEIRLLSTSTKETVTSDEQAWIHFWMVFCDILNVRDGPSGYIHRAN